MKAHELLSSSDLWCQESPAKDTHGHKVEALNPKAVKWCALAAIQKLIPRANRKRPWIACCVHSAFQKRV
jgi:hypothetical protein